MRRSVLVVAASVALSGCGGSEQHAVRPAEQAPPGSLQALWDRPGENVTLVPGTSDYGPGDVRVSFLVIRHDGRPAGRPRARLWVSRSLRARPFLTGTAVLERIVPPSASADQLDVTALYVGHLRLPRPGRYWLLAEPVGGRPVQAVGNVVVQKRSQAPEVGESAPRSRTPTLRTAPVRSLTTRTPPDLPLLRWSVAESIAVHAPFVVVFATPKLCTSRTCGPVVDVVLSVARRFPSVRFIHVEIYRDNDPTKGYNRWVREWRLPTEPWTFLVGRDSRIREKFEGSVSVRELADAVRRSLVRQ